MRLAAQVAQRGGVAGHARHVWCAGHATAFRHGRQIARCQLGQAQAPGGLVDRLDTAAEPGAQGFDAPADHPGVTAQAPLVGPRLRGRGEQVGGVLPGLLAGGVDAPGGLLLVVAGELVPRGTGGTSCAWRRGLHRHRHAWRHVGV